MPRRPRLALEVQYGVRPRSVPSRAQFRRWARAALARDAAVTVRIVGGAEGRSLNRRFRGRDYATNVLTFVMRRRPRLEGDLALCAPVIAREAKAQRKNPAAHYAHLLIHGLLHLQGYDHARAREAAAMERRETRIVKRLGFDDPYAERAGTAAKGNGDRAPRAAGLRAASRRNPGG